MFVTLISSFFINLMSTCGSSKMVYPLNASLVKHIQNVNTWNVEIDKELIRMIHSSVCFHSVCVVAELKEEIEREWATCALSAAPVSKKGNISSRCMMFAASHTFQTNFSSHKIVLLQVPPWYGLNFTVLKLKSFYSGKCSAFASENK